MSRKQRVLRRSIFIACEGHTELRYFEALGEEVNSSPKYAVRVELLELEDGVRQDPVGLVEEAIRNRNEQGYDEVWVVFDRDRDRNPALQEAFDLALADNINVAFSSIAFEHYILLHFEKNDTAFERSDCESRGDDCVCEGATCVSTYLKIRHFPEYEKGSVKLYGRIKSRNNDVIENAAWLRFKNRNRLSPALEILPPYTLNPHTDVDRLLIKLLELERVKYTRMNVVCTVDGLDFIVLSLQNGLLSVSIRNNRGTACVFNNTTKFSLKDSNAVGHAHSMNSVVINPGQEQVIDVNFQIPHGADIREFHFREGGTLMIAGLTVEV